MKGIIVVDVVFVVLVYLLVVGYVFDGGSAIRVYY